MPHDYLRTNIVEQLVDALRTLGAEGPACAADVFDQVDKRWPRDVRDAVLREMAAVEKIAQLSEDDQL